MRQTTLALACCWALSLCLAQTATAQDGNTAISTAATRSEPLSAPVVEIEHHAPDTLVEQPLHDALYDADVPPMPNLFPADFHHLVPTFDTSSKLLLGLLGLLLLGVLLSGLGAKKSA